MGVTRGHLLLLTAAIAVLVVIALIIAGLSPDPIAGGELPAKDELERLKLREEAEKLRGDRTTVARLLPVLGPVVTALIAGGTLWQAVRRAAQDRADQRRDADRKRFDERFAAATANLGSAEVAKSVSAAILVDSMVREVRAELSGPALSLLVASLQIDHDDVTTRLLVRSLQRTIRAGPARFLPRPGGGDPEATLTFVRAPGINLERVELAGVDLAFMRLRHARLAHARLEGALGTELDLSDADLDRASLRNVRWHVVTARRTTFRDARLEGARMTRATLTGADFYRARMAGAILDESTFENTKFERADLAGARFARAVFDDLTLDSIVRAENWRDGVFDGPVRERLEQRAGAA